MFATIALFTIILTRGSNSFSHLYDDPFFKKDITKFLNPGLFEKNEEGSMFCPYEKIHVDRIEGFGGHDLSPAVLQQKVA